MLGDGKMGTGLAEFHARSGASTEATVKKLHFSTEETSCARLGRRSRRREEHTRWPGTHLTVRNRKPLATGFDRPEFSSTRRPEDVACSMA